MGFYIYDFLEIGIQKLSYFEREYEYKEPTRYRLDHLLLST